MKALRTRIQRLEDKSGPSEAERNSVLLTMVQTMVGMEITGACFAGEPDADEKIEAAWKEAWGDGVRNWCTGRHSTKVVLRDDGTVRERIETLKRYNREAYPPNRREEWTFPVRETKRGSPDGS